jgi:hypothetical protein
VENLSYAEDMGNPGDPDPPGKPDPPRYFVGRGTLEAGASRVMHVTRVRPSVRAFTEEDPGYRED